jgi:hypothetical protein
VDLADRARPAEDSRGDKDDQDDRSAADGGADYLGAGLLCGLRTYK